MAGGYRHDKVPGATRKYSTLKLKQVLSNSLGSGTGVTSIAAALLGARHVICTDDEPRVVQLAHDNIDRAIQQLGVHPTDFELIEPSSSFITISRPSGMLMGNRDDTEWGLVRRYTGG
jgi:predicted RNA methylase